MPLHKHYCEGILKKAQFVIEPESCHTSLEVEKSCCCESGNQKTECNAGINEEDCCSNTVQFIKADVNTVIENQDKIFKLKLNLIPEFFNYIFSNNNSFKYYSDKKIDDKIPITPGIKIIILKQSFLC